MRRGYFECRYGQLHVHNAIPPGGGFEEGTALLCLHQSAASGRVFTRSQLLDAIHGVAIESYERAIDAHVKNIRRKIEADPREPQRLLTVYGVGYRLTDA